MILRKVGEHRCWFCTGVAAIVGLMISALSAWFSLFVFRSLGVVNLAPLGNLQILVFGLGVSYTIWRSLFWGFLPYQEWVAYWFNKHVSLQRQNDSKLNG